MKKITLTYIFLLIFLSNNSHSIDAMDNNNKKKYIQCSICHLHYLPSAIARHKKAHDENKPFYNKISAKKIKLAGDNQMLPLINPYDQNFKKKENKLKRKQEYYELSEKYPDNYIRTISYAELKKIEFFLGSSPILESFINQPQIIISQKKPLHNI